MDSLVLQCANHLKTSSIADMYESWIFVSAKVSLKNSSVFGSIKQCSPCIQLTNPIWCFLCMQFGHAPLIEILSAAHRICKMYFPVIAIIHICHCCSYTTFSHHRVCFPQK